MSCRVDMDDVLWEELGPLAKDDIVTNWLPGIAIGCRRRTVATGQGTCKDDFIAVDGVLFGCLRSRRGVDTLAVDLTILDSDVVTTDLKAPGHDPFDVRCLGSMVDNEATGSRTQHHHIQRDDLGVREGQSVGEGFDELKRRGLGAEIITYNAAISAVSEAWSTMAVDLFDEARRSSLSGGPGRTSSRPSKHGPSRFRRRRSFAVGSWSWCGL